MVEHNLAKVGVASSNLVSRSKTLKNRVKIVILYPIFLPLKSCRLEGIANGSMAEWLCSGLQSRVRRFDSGSSLHLLVKETAMCKALL